MRSLWFGLLMIVTLNAVGQASAPIASSAIGHRHKCGPAPANSVTIVQCPSGYMGSWSQYTTWVQAPYPQCWTAVVSPTSAPAGSCVLVCPAQPVTTTATIQCPTGYAGSWTQTTTWVRAPSPTCWTPVLTPTVAPTGACTCP